MATSVFINKDFWRGLMGHSVTMDFEIVHEDGPVLDGAAIGRVTAVQLERAAEGQPLRGRVMVGSIWVPTHSVTRIRDGKRTWTMGNPS